METSCFYPSLSSPFQMEIKLSSNDLYPLGCQCREEAENTVSVCVCVDPDEPQCCSPLSVACLRPLNFWSMAGQILAATPGLDRPCPFKIERWLACFGSWSAEGSHELTRRETRSGSLEEGRFLTTVYWPNGFKGKQTLRCKSQPAGNSPIKFSQEIKDF